VGRQVSLDGRSSRGEAPLECEWSFENEDASTVWETRAGCRIDFTFRLAGTKHVRLTVTGADGETDSSVRSFDVTAAPALASSAGRTLAGSAS
jgi:hypothetical protein